MRKKRSTDPQRVQNTQIFIFWILQRLVVVVSPSMDAAILENKPLSREDDLNTTVFHKLYVAFFYFNM